MNISILVFGSDRFFATLPDRSRDRSAFSVEVIANLDQVVSRIQNAPPDVILVQASLDGSMGLCSWLKEQTKLSWIHCILLEDRTHVLTERSNRDYSWESEMVSAALCQGADAYMWWLPENASFDSSAESTAQENLLLAQLTVGLRKAQKYRDLIRTNDLLSAIALSDALTELNNRRALEWDLPKLIHQARTQKTPLSLIILDVDYFKKVNDTYGHLVGDRLLQLLCARLRHNLRFQDTPFRYGGEEFVIILGNTTCEEASLVAKRLNRIIGDEPFVINNTLSIKVTISLGTACLRNDDDAKGMSLLHRADEYLLEAKASGRDRVIGCDEYISQQPHLRAVSS
ncbi:GGDEF domain-containing response regulator [Brunnivagina elsteri]|uniref:GGDEF domain-containing protein n=1 Tax=Brunnivagina elsteri CCALA 953 TaxID=987040 RepID=A0A2A2TH87_9CYAN|nr:diguanylate cyclase [Calothrix elsteri]PAX53092.1 GGDEF domain-containing protein [Calothrix elsteri CCALA 953]